MNKRVRKPPKPTAADFLREGNVSFRAGRHYLAAEAFEKARKLEPRSAAILFNLASAKERVGEITEAAVLLTQAVRLRPSWPEASARLALILLRYSLDSAKDLDPHGLLAAFAFDQIDQRAIAAISLDHLNETTLLGPALKEAWNGDADEVARGLILRRTDRSLADRLLLTAISAAPNFDIGYETLLAAIRRVLLLEVSAERFEDKALTGFVLALIRQCISNDYVFPAGEAEWAQLDAMLVDWEALQSGDMDEARRLMLNLLYRAPDHVLPSDLTVENCRAIRPRALGELLAEWLDERNQLAEIAAGLPSIGAIEDATSVKVAGQYETHPYPRWRSLQIPVEACAVPSLQPFFTAERLAFMDKPFKVLIAGAGTGQQAVVAAVRYGPKADVFAVDLSRASLAYAKARAENFGIKNLRFAQCDLLQIADSGEGPFDVIESVGVLHHMADPFKGWQSLTQVLRPGGIMLTGLYSDVSRREITALRNDPNYPGAECDDNTARQYRAALLERRDELAAAMSASRDFYTMNEFRDLVLHQYERPIFLSEIEAFLEQNNLTFKGFQLPPPVIAHYRQHSPEHTWPGSFENWRRYEEDNPHSFDAMYQLWCEKAE